MLATHQLHIGEKRKERTAVCRPLPANADEALRVEIAAEEIAKIDAAGVALGGRSPARQRSSTSRRGLSSGNIVLGSIPCTTAKLTFKFKNKDLEP